MNIFEPKARAVSGQWIRFILLVAVLALASASAFAKSEDGIDVVFILDSSGSMKQSDANRLRVQASKMFVNLLNENDRAAVISFSGQAYRITNLLPLNKRSNESRLLAALDKISEKGAFTNIYDALDKGAQLLKKNRQHGRKQHILLMSDGKMDVGHKETDLRLTEKTLEDIGPELAKARIKIHTVTFSHSDNIPLMKLAAEDTKGTFSVIENPAQIHEIFDRIFERSKQPDMLPINEDSFIVDRNIQEITIVASKYRSNSRIVLESPNGDEYSAKTHHPSVRWFNAQKFDLITIKNPASGYWLIKFSEANDKAYVITDLKMMAQAASEVQVGNSFEVQAWLQKNGKLVKGRALTGSGQYLTRVIHPDGSVSEHALIDDGIDGDTKANDGYFTTRLSFNTPGTYKIATIVKGETFDRQKTLFVTVTQAQSMASPFEVKDQQEQLAMAETPQAAMQQPATEAPEAAPQAEQPTKAVAETEHKAAEPQTPSAETKAETPTTDTEADSSAEQPAEETPADTPAAAQEESMLLPGLGIFVLVNFILATIAGTYIFIRKKYLSKHKVAVDDDESLDLENLEENQGSAENAETPDTGEGEAPPDENAGAEVEEGEASDGEEKA